MNRTLKPEFVCQTVTNSDTSCETLVATESRDEDEKSQTSCATDERDQADAFVAPKRSMLRRKSNLNVEERPPSSPHGDNHYTSAFQPVLSFSPDGRGHADAVAAAKRAINLNGSCGETEAKMPMTPYRGKQGDANLPTLLPSPTASFGTPPIKNKDDASSFSLFGHSFDSVSNTTDLGDNFPVSPLPRKDHLDIDISLPTLSHGDENNISPIKIDLDQHNFDEIDTIVYRYEEGDHDHHQQHEHHWEDPFPSAPPPRPYGYEAYRSDTTHAYSNPVFVLRSCRDAFRGCTFVLSHVQDPNPLVVQCTIPGSFYRHHNPGNMQSQYYDPRDLVIACHRVKAAVCAFGGWISVAPPRGRMPIFRGVDHWNAQYASRLHRRYHLNGSQISWDAEENPPIHIDPDESIGQTKQERLDEIQLSPEGSPERDCAHAPTPSPTTECGDDQPKMKYRCKLCGQPKQNHNCPYRHAMQRNIGISVYPAVNAYTASEPGHLAPALSDMNNFIDRSDDGFLDTARPSPHAPDSSVLTPPCGGSGGSDNRKRKYAETLDPEPIIRQVSPFAQAESLCREQYRAISAPAKEGDFQYPPLPLSFQERKRLSDTLFALSKEIHHLHEEVASILHDARARDLWDMAVAQVMTQVIVALYCGEGDKRLDGLHHYLLGIGISS